MPRSQQCSAELKTVCTAFCAAFQKSRHAATTTADFGALPLVYLRRLFSFMEVKDALRCFRVCKSWSAACLSSQGSLDLGNTMAIPSAAIRYFGNFAVDVYAGSFKDTQRKVSHLVPWRQCRKRLPQFLERFARVFCGSIKSFIVENCEFLLQTGEEIHA